MQDIGKFLVRKLFIQMIIKNIPNRVCRKKVFNNINVVGNIDIVIKIKVINWMTKK